MTEYTGGNSIIYNKDLIDKHYSDGGTTSNRQIKTDSGGATESRDSL